MKPFILSVFLAILFSELAQAQILDDSTKQIYSHKTVKYRFESNLLTNRKMFLGDTSLVEFSQKGDFIYQGNEIYQNLGVFGTSSKPLFYKNPDAIGLRNGVNMFDYLIPNGDKIKYFNTFSPYTEIKYTQGAKQRSSIKVTFSQNVLPRLNFAAHYQRFTALRILNISRSEERLVDHHSAYISGNYSSKDKNYKIWGYYQHLNHLQYETGGAVTNTSGKLDSIFITPEIMPVTLASDARNRDLRNVWYASQVWKPFGNSFYLRTSHLRHKQINTYNDPRPNLAFYGQANSYFQSQRSIQTGISDTLSSERQYQLWENTLFVGIQDSLIQASFYIKRRDTDYRTNLFTFLQKKAELLYGFQYNAEHFGGDAKVNAEMISPSEYDVRLAWLFKNLNTELRWMVFKPSLIQREFFSKNLVYFNDFESSKSLRFKIDYALKWKKWTLIPGFEQITVDKGIAFNSSFSPFQTNGISTMQYASLGLNGKIGRVFSTENRFIRVFQMGPIISQMPAYVYHSAHWFDVLKSKSGFEVQLGFNLDWRFDWPSESYNPLTGQWFLQNATTIPPYFLVDVFAHIKIDRARFYFKVHNTLQKLGSLGYFAAPYYPAQRRLFEIGLSWTFFD